MRMATKLRVLLWWARAKRFVYPLLAAMLGALVALKLRKPAEPQRDSFAADRARTDKILADAVRPHVAARVEAAKAEAAASVAAAKDAHAKALGDAAKVHTASPSELDGLLKAYAKKVRTAAKLLVLGYVLASGSAQAQAEPRCDETRCVLELDVARSLLADASMVPSLRIEVERLNNANAKLAVALDAQGVAASIDAAALRSLAVELDVSAQRERALRAKVDAWYRRPVFLLVVGFVVGAGGALAVAL